LIDEARLCVVGYHAVAGRIGPSVAASVIARVWSCRGDEPAYFDRYGSWRPQLFSSKANMNSVGKIPLHSRLWIAALAAPALGIGTWSIASAPADAGVIIGVGIPFPGLYAQYPYYPYPPAYSPYYPPPAPAYSPAPSYTPQPSYPPRAGRSGGNIARQLNQQELNRLRAAPVYPPPPPYYPAPPRY
jgi:hypothetical protein